MKGSSSLRWLMKKRHFLFDVGVCGAKMRQLPFMGVVCIVMLFIIYRTTNYQYQQTEMESKLYPFYSFKDSGVDPTSLNSLPRGIIEARSDLELKPLWTTSSSKSKTSARSSNNLLAMPVGIKQKENVDTIVQKFLLENFTIILFHYDGNMDDWWDLEWSKEAIHIVAHKQTKWWFAKRFLHPAVVSIYDYIFLWDEDLGVKNFHPGRYLEIVKSAGLEISQPALDPNSTGIHHRITIRNRMNIFHRRVYDVRGSIKCSNDSEGPPCTGFVEGMAPVFSRSAWLCAWHLIQNDLVHGWGMDMKLGYCAQGDRTKNVGIVDSEYIVHQSIQTLGGSSAKKVSHPEKKTVKRHGVDVRLEIRRQSMTELQKFKERWERAVEEDRKSRKSLQLKLDGLIKMAGRYDRNPFEEEEEVNPFADGGARGKASGQSTFGGGSFYTVGSSLFLLSFEKKARMRVLTTGSVAPATNSRLSPLPPEPADFYNPTAPVDIPLDSAADIKKKEKELQAKEAELKRREQEVRRKEEAAARAGIVLEEKNWPPFFPIIHHDIANEIPIHLQRLQYVAFTTFLGLTFALLWNLIAVTTAWIKQGGAYVLWYRPLYRAFRTEGALKFAWFFLFYLRYPASCGSHKQACTGWGKLESLEDNYIQPVLEVSADGGNDVPGTGQESANMVLHFNLLSCRAISLTIQQNGPVSLLTLLSVTQVFYFIGFGLFCLESVLSIWVIQQVYMYFRGSGKAAEMKREAARGAVRAAF
ncbi:hypothetical protein BUALT_Bualt18G0110400 [Buddleja alternifolia]|uniref:Secretory carrier-associated membrane protein n=1 Tax=Buddleja alternifolia TaxID=168488 RepID=A0AAV6WDT5_9LAMI|nr:hypothetical protein BUALT_Bualt18G0110400 [Buddleja alternifolia]